MDLSGTFPVLPTIFTDAGAVDAGATIDVLDYLADAGADGVVFPGLASEYDMLSAEERLDLTEKVGRRARDRLPFIVGASAATPDEAARFAEAGAHAGAAAAMIMTPHALAGDLTAMTDFYARAGARSGIRLMLQNAPPPMGIGLSLDDVATISRAVDAIRYVKEETMPSGQRITRLSALAGDALDAVFGGAGARYVIDELARGAVGTMPAAEITELHVAMVAAYRAGREDEARTLFERTLPLLSMQAVFRWRLTKEVLRRRGIIRCAFVRAPGPALDPDDHRELGALLARVEDILPLRWTPWASVA